MGGASSARFAWVSVESLNATYRDSAESAGVFASADAMPVQAAAATRATAATVTERMRFTRLANSQSPLRAE